MGLIRFILALSVVTTHCGPLFGWFRFVGGDVAVQAFYIISGFYMSLILNKKYVGVNKSYSLFISNRMLRLFPIYWAVLISSCIAYIIIGIATNNFAKFELYNLTNPFSFVFLVFTNICIFLQDMVMFMGINPTGGSLFYSSNFQNTDPRLYEFLFIPQAWSLGVELLFYIIAPFILVRGFKAIIPLVIGSIVLRMVLYNVFLLQEDPWSYRFFPTELLFFLLGYCSYRMIPKLNFNNSKIPYLVLLFIVGFTVIYQITPPIYFTASPFSLKQILYYGSITFAIPVLFNKFKNNAIDNNIGELSYPIYVSHMFVLYIMSALPLGRYGNGTTIAVITIIISLLLIRTISNPIENIRQARLKKSGKPASQGKALQEMNP